MAIKQIDIRLMEMKAKLQKLENRGAEILEEKLTLMAKLEREEVDPILCMLKVQAMDYEMFLMVQQAKELEAEFGVIQMAQDLNIDFAKEDF
jgi:hypothetical protein